MFTIKKNKFLLLLVFVLSASFANAAQKGKKQDIKIKDFLESTEFAIQRQILRSDVSGQKGFVTKKNTEKKEDLFGSDVSDPFNNQTVEAVMEYKSLDDGIEEEEILEQEDYSQDVVVLYREKIDEIMANLAKSMKVNPVDLLNSLTINRIMTSPKKFVVIKGRKYALGEQIDVRYSGKKSRTDFEAELDSINISTNTVEEQKLIEEEKTQALDRFDEMMSSGTVTKTAVRIKNISFRSVEFLINGKEYELKMKY